MRLAGPYHAGVRRSIAAAFIAAALLIAASGLAAVPAPATTGSPDDPTGAEEVLFTVQAARGTTTPLTADGSVNTRFRFTLTAVDPVTVFANRPYRDAWLISPRALDANWNAWFAGDPPNAVMTYARPGKAPASMVVELTNPTYKPATRSLSFTAIRLQRTNDPTESGANGEPVTAPATMNGVSLFIDLTKANKKEA